MTQDEVAARAGVRRPAVRAAGRAAGPHGRRAGRRTPRRARRHPPEPVRAGLLRHPARAAAGPARGRRGPAGLRPGRPARRRRRYIGRLGLSDDEQTQLLVDWRAPAAARLLPGDRGLPRRGRPPPAPGRPAAARSTGVEDEALDLDSLDARPAQLADRRGRPAGGGRRAPHRPDGRHRGHHPGRAGPGDPQRPGRAARRAGRPRHRQDRGRAAPRGVPALHPPRAAEPPAASCSSGPTRCSCATSSRCCPSLGETGVVLATAAELYPASAASHEPRRRGGRAQGRRADGPGRWPRAVRGPAARAGRQPGARVGSQRLTLTPRRRRHGPVPGPPQPQAAQRGPRGLPRATCSTCSPAGSPAASGTTLTSDNRERPARGPARVPGRTPGAQPRAGCR